MKFGTKLIGLNKGAGLQYTTVPSEWNTKGYYAKNRHLYVFPIVTFMFERPDTGMFVVESVEREGSLHEDAPDTFLLFDEKSLPILEEKINHLFDKKVAREMEKQEELHHEMAEATEKKNEIESEILHLEELNKKEYTENRAKTTRQMSKGLRRKINRLNVIEGKLNETKQRIQTIEEDKEYSILYLKEEFDAYSRKGLLDHE